MNSQSKTKISTPIARATRLTGLLASLKEAVDAGEVPEGSKLTLVIPRLQGKPKPPQE